MKSNETNRKKLWIAAAVVLIVVIVISIFGKRETPDDNWATSASKDMNDKTVETTSGDDLRGETMTVESEVPVSEQELELLSSLYAALSTSSYVDAAQILNDHETEFEILTDKILNGEKYYYFEVKNTDGQTVPKMDQLPMSGTMEGLVLTRYNTAFYGEFEDGKPNGNACVIQTMILDEPRYTFAEGMWSDGKMNGEGKTGYHYYLNAPESGFVYTEKSGNYRNDQLDGVFTYLTENGGGETLTWEIQAVNGATVLTEEWTHYPFRKEYMLSSKESEERAYVLSEERASAVIWNNLITWDN